MSSSPIERLRRICLALPEATEKLSHGEPCFFAGKKSFASFANNHHGDGRIAVWCAAPLGAQEALIALDAQRFFRPPYVGHRGWVGMRLDLDPDWDRVAAVIADAYRTIAPARLAAQIKTDD